MAKQGRKKKNRGIWTLMEIRAESESYKGRV